MSIGIGIITRNRMKEWHPHPISFRLPVIMNQNPHACTAVAADKHSTAQHASPPQRRAHTSRNPKTKEGKISHSHCIRLDNDPS